MQGIINPSFFYWADVANYAKYIFIVLFGIAITAAIIFAIIYVIDLRNYGNDDRDTKNSKKIFRLSVIACAVFIVPAVFILSDETMYKMLIASYATPENIEILEEYGKDGIDYLVDKINEIDFSGNHDEE